MYSTDRIDEVEMMGGKYGSMMALEVDATAVIAAVRLSETVKTVDASAPQVSAPWTWL